MSTSVMNKNDLERLFQRVLNEGQYKKVRSYLDSEPLNFDLSQQEANFVITNAGSTVNQKKTRSSNKGILRHGSLNKNSSQSSIQVEEMNI